MILGDDPTEATFEVLKAFVARRVRRLRRAAADTLAERARLSLLVRRQLADVMAGRPDLVGLMAENMRKVAQLGQEAQRLERRAEDAECLAAIFDGADAHADAHAFTWLDRGG